MEVPLALTQDERRRELLTEADRAEDTINAYMAEVHDSVRPLFQHFLQKLDDVRLLVRWSQRATSTTWAERFLDFGTEEVRMAISGFQRLIAFTEDDGGPATARAIS